jgi:uncharacterized protein (DUF2267 family)
MTFDKFIGEVQHRAHLPSIGDVLRAAQAVLQTFGERLDASEAKDLASQLPRAGVDVPAAVYQPRVVFELLEEAVSAGEIADVRAQQEWGELFESGSTEQIQLGASAHSS